MRWDDGNSLSSPRLWEAKDKEAYQEYQFMQLPIYKAITNVTITTTGSVVYWKC
jgi:hypothetical protein